MRWLSRDPLGEATGAGQGTNLYGYVLGGSTGDHGPVGNALLAEMVGR